MQGSFQNPLKKERGKFKVWNYYTNAFTSFNYFVIIGKCQKENREIPVSKLSDGNNNYEAEMTNMRRHSFEKYGIIMNLVISCVSFLGFNNIEKCVSTGMKSHNFWLLMLSAESWWCALVRFKHCFWLSNQNFFLWQESLYISEPPTFPFLDRRG